MTTVRREGQFKLSGEFSPAGDQPAAIDQLVEGIQGGDRHQTLLGVTGTGKTFTIANVIARVNKPTLVIAPNKSLGAQLANEFREIFPENAVEYFVSYYDYYQPEAYLPQTDTYIEKDSSINDEIERLRHSATSALQTRRDVLIVASVSCIYGLGSPEEYEQQILRVHKGVPFDRDLAIQRLVDIQYERNQANLVRGKFRVQGDTLEVMPAYEQTAVRIEWWGDTVDRILRMDLLTGEVLDDLNEITVFPATHYVASEERLKMAIGTIEEELQERLAVFERENKLLEAQRLRMRTNYDLEMLREMGFCSGIENYSRHLDGAIGGRAAVHAARLLPGGLAVRHRREPRHRAADPRHVRGRHVPQADAGRVRVPAAVGDGQPAAALRGVRRARPADRVHVGDAGAVRAAGVQRGSSSRSSARPAWSTRSSRSGRPRARSTT